MRQTILLVGALSLFALSASADPIEYDSEFSSDQIQLITKDLDRLSQLRFEEGEDSHFVSIFGGARGDHVAAYLQERARYLVPASVDITARVSGTYYFAPPAELKDAQGQVIAVLNAYNFGTDLFFEQMLYWADSTVRFSKGWFSSVEVLTARVGLIELGARFFERKDPANPGKMKATSSVERLATLIHEARHSDCTGGLSQSDYERIVRHLPIVNVACGHQHALCPAGHPSAGQPMCDAHPWGAYAIETTFLDAIALHCSNCTAEEKAAASSEVEDRRSRVLNWEGVPDMSNGGPPWSL